MEPGVTKPADDTNKPQGKKRLSENNIFDIQPSNKRVKNDFLQTITTGVRAASHDLNNGKRVFSNLLDPSRSSKEN